MEGAVGFERNESNPLETDVVIIDEMSMVDISLMQSLLKDVYKRQSRGTSEGLSYEKLY